MPLGLRSAYNRHLPIFSLTESGQHAFVLLLVFALAKFLAELFERMSVPGMIGEILAGLALGNSFLGWVTPSPFLDSLSELGVMFLLFRVGLEVNVQELLGVGRVALLVAAGGVVVPFACGWGIASAFGYTGVESIFVGAALVATSVGITAKVLASKRVLWHRSSQIILAAAVIDDVLGLLVLAVVSGTAKGAVDVPRLLLTTLLTVTFVSLIAFFGPKAVDRITPHLRKNMRSVEAEFSLAMIVLFALSFAAIQIGVAAIIGAFLAGMAFSGTAGPRLRDLTSGATELLLPFFLAGIGLHVQLKEFHEPRMIVLALILLVAAVFSKVVGCGLCAFGAATRDRLRIGIGMMPRGEVGMVVAQLGLTMGALTQSLYAVVVAVCVGTTLIAPPLLTYTYRDVKPRGQSRDYPTIL